MFKQLKKFTVQMLAGANIATVVVMLLVGYSDRLYPADHPILSTLGMTFPLFLIVNLLFLFFWLIFKWTRSWIPVGGFLLIRYWRNHPDSSQRFGRSRGQEFFDNLKRKYDERQQNNRMKANQTGYDRAADSRRESDAEYNARQRKNQEEIDAILDKIRKSGYDSLTKEEKQKLFDQSRSN